MLFKLEKKRWRSYKNCAWCNRRFREGFRLVFSNSSWTYVCSHRCAMNLIVNSEFNRGSWKWWEAGTWKVYKILREHRFEQCKISDNLNYIHCPPSNGKPEVLFMYDIYAPMLIFDYIDEKHIKLIEELALKTRLLFLDTSVKVIVDVRHSPRDLVPKLSSLLKNLRAKGVII